MNRTATLITSLAIVGLSACSAQQRHMVQQALADEAPATTEAPAGPTSDVVATCDTITVTTAGWPEGSYAILGMGESNGGPPINSTHTYPVTPNEWNNYYRDGLRWVLIVQGPDIARHQIQGIVYCDGQMITS